MLQWWGTITAQQGKPDVGPLNGFIRAVQTRSNKTQTSGCCLTLKRQPPPAEQPQQLDPMQQEIAAQQAAQQSEIQSMQADDQLAGAQQQRDLIAQKHGLEQERLQQQHEMKLQQMMADLQSRQLRNEKASVELEHLPTKLKQRAK